MPQKWETKSYYINLWGLECVDHMLKTDHFHLYCSREGPVLLMPVYELIEEELSLEAAVDFLGKPKPASVIYREGAHSFGNQKPPSVIFR